ncbi:MAG TPA: YibE/F family protein, partial [Candidatus Gracilibacteria bacterium]|nr:YibE/F family protein [Candidatus Gracilibacteria bacterium]
MNKIKKIGAIFALFLAISMPVPTHAQDTEMKDLDPSEMQFIIPPETYDTATVEEVTDNGDAQDVRLRINGGEEKGKFINVQHGQFFSITEDQKVSKGETVIISKGTSGDMVQYMIQDHYRTPGVLLILLFFIAAVLIFGRKKGFMSLVGLSLTICVLIFFIIPAQVAGANPFIVSIIGAFFIALLSLYLSHGFQRRTTIALIATLITLIISAILAIVFVELTKLSGAGNEDAFFLQFGELGHINIKGLLLGGIIIGALGVLDDITTAQSAAVEEIHKADKKLSQKELFQRGISVGNEHIASLVNTLVLAYAGASFPLLLFFSVEGLVPLWVTLNKQYMVEEIVRTLVGSTALIFAVPITTWLAAWSFTRKRS